MIPIMVTDYFVQSHKGEYHRRREQGETFRAGKMRIFPLLPVFQKGHSVFSFAHNTVCQVLARSFQKMHIMNRSDIFNHPPLASARVDVCLSPRTSAIPCGKRLPTIHVAICISTVSMRQDVWYTDTKCKSLTEIPHRVLYSVNTYSMATVTELGARLALRSRGTATGPRIDSR